MHTSSVRRHVGHHHHHHHHEDEDEERQSTQSANSKLAAASSNRDALRSKDYLSARQAASSRITIIGFVANIGLAICKFTAGIVGNSYALIADGFHSLSDMVTDMFTLWSSKASARPKSSQWPFGRGKIESTGTAAISAALIATAASIGWEALQHIYKLAMAAGDAPIETPTQIAVIAACVSILVKEILYRATARVGRKYDSKLILANALHHRTDAYSSAVALLGVAFARQLPMLDPIAALVVSFMILRGAKELGLEAWIDLTDQSVDAKTLSRASSILNSLHSEGVLSHHSLRGRRAGAGLFLDCTLCVDGRLSVSAANQVAERARLHVLAAMPRVNEILMLVEVQRNKTEKNRHEASQSHSHAAAESNSKDSASTASSRHAVHTHVQQEDNVSDQVENLARSQAAIEADVMAVVRQAQFKTQILDMSHFTVHYTSGKHILVQCELIMPDRLSIAEARLIAESFRHAVLLQVSDVSALDLHLELSQEHKSEHNEQR